MNTSKITILIIEDEPDIQHLLKYNLKQDGYQVLTSNNGETGLEMAQTNNDEWVIIDGTKSQEDVAKDVDQAIHDRLQLP